MQPLTKCILALDVGERRIGVAVARPPVYIAQTLITLENTPEFTQLLQKLISENDVSDIVIGLPRGLDGQETDQTRSVQNFVKELKHSITLAIHLQDEAVTSVKAQQELAQNGKLYNKSDVDSLAAVYILEDYLGGVRKDK